MPHKVKKNKNNVDVAKLQLVVENDNRVNKKLKHIEYRDSDELTLVFDGEIDNTEDNALDDIMVNYITLAAAIQIESDIVITKNLLDSIPKSIYGANYNGRDKMKDEFLDMAGNQSINPDTVTYLAPYNGFLDSITINHNGSKADGWIWVLRLTKEATSDTVPDLLLSISIKDKSEIVSAGYNIPIAQSDRIAIYYRKDKKETEDILVNVAFKVNEDNRGVTLTEVERADNKALFVPWLGDYWNAEAEYAAPNAED